MRIMHRGRIALPSAVFAAAALLQGCVVGGFGAGYDSGYSRPYGYAGGYGVGRWGEGYRDPQWGHGEGDEHRGEERGGYADRDRPREDQRRSDED